MIGPKMLIWVSVLLSAGAQIFLKKGMMRVRARSRAAQASILSYLWGAAGDIFVWLWAFSFVIALVLWIIGLQKVDLSYAYPLVSGGYVLVTVLAALFLREKVPVKHWLAIAVICLGVWLISAT